MKHDALWYLITILELFYYWTLQKAFEGLAKTAAFLSKALFQFVCGVADVWEVHSASLQGTEQQLQDRLEEVSKNYEEKHQVRLITCALRCEA